MNNLSLFYIRHNRGGQAAEITETAIPYFDLTVVLEGTLHYRVDGTPVALGRGDAILVPRGARRAREATGERVDYISFNFHAVEPPSLPAVLREAVRPETKLMIAACDEIVRRHPLGYEQAGSHLLSAILLSFQNNLQEREISPLTAKIVAYLNKNIAERITLDEVGRITFFSPVYCDTVFKRDMGTSIIDYLLAQRVAEAKRLLLEGTLALSEVARMTGFEDSNYFSRVFKKRTGYTPSAYKKMARAEWL
ncbi:MAG: helix-turn-helix domain-containing protein [Clostridia bacterium]|nr:helix-turn-helix domain-containing protein [Clostridia bacterium]